MVRTSNCACSRITRLLRNVVRVRTCTCVCACDFVLSQSWKDQSREDALRRRRERERERRARETMRLLSRERLVCISVACVMGKTLIFTRCLAVISTKIPPNKDLQFDRRTANQYDMHLQSEDFRYIGKALHTRREVRIWGEISVKLRTPTSVKFWVHTFLFWVHTFYLGTQVSFGYTLFLFGYTLFFAYTAS